jgi:dipeptidyl aminopeptidase/acylaminoacyl peptidase
VSNWLFVSVACLIIGAACGGSAPTSSTPTTSPASNRTNVQLPGAGVTLGGILVRPVESGPRPAIIVLHGFQQAGTNGASLVEPLAAEFASLGYVGLALSMRGWPPSGGVDDCGLRQPDDIASALEWLAAQPGVDAARLAVIGYSQGGQVALLTATRTPRARAIVAYYPVTDVERWKTTTSFSNIPPYITSVCEPGGADLRSPVAQAARITAPVLLVHGDADTRVPTEQSLLLRDAMQRAGGAVQLVLVPGAAHGFSMDSDPSSRAAVLSFLTSALGRTQ